MSDEIKGISQLPDWALDMVDSSSFSQNGDACYEALHLAMALLNADRAARAQGGEAVGFVTQSAMDQLRKGHPAKIYAPENRVVTMKPVIRLYANLGEPDK